MKKVFNFLKCTLSILICIALTLGCILGVQKILCSKESEKLYGTFKEIAPDLDVLFFGSSHVWEGIYPMELWNDYGITSYIAGYSAYRMPMTYWSMELAYEYANPKLVVIDVALLSETAISNSPESVHILLDAFPYSETKARAAEALTDTLDKTIDVFDLKLPLSVYHGRWDKLEEEDFKVPTNVSRGARKVHGVVPLQPAEKLPKDDVTNDYNISMEYLEKAVKLAQSKGSEVLLTFIPQPSLPEAKRYYNWCYKLAEKYGVTYIDFTEIDDLIDYSTDFNDFTSGEDRKKTYEDKGQLMTDSVYDNSAHLNYSGATKLTKWIGQYIRDNYSIADHRGDSHFDYWNEDYKEWAKDE